MRAAVCRGFGQPLEIEEVTLHPPGPGQIEVRLAACAICHSDLAYAEGAWGGALPVVYGHEASGHVTARGAGVEGIALGDPVVVTLIRACGRCPACASGAPTSCARAWDTAPSPLSDATGAPIAQGMNTGAFAEAVVVDAAQCAVLPGDFDLEHAALLACGVLTGVGAVVNTARMPPGAEVAVIGAGGVGLNTIQGAAIAGAARIIAVDLAEDKLSAARDFGATDGVRAGPDARAQIRALTGGRGVDFAFVTVGAPRAFADAQGLLAAGGAVVVVGLPPAGTMVPYDPVALASLNQRLLGSRMGESVLARDIPRLIAQARAGRLKLGSLISGRFPLERINEAIAATRAGAARRNLIVFDPVKGKGRTP